MTAPALKPSRGLLPVCALACTRRDVFGGTRAEASNQLARQIVREYVRGTRVAWVDMHTGLGAYGDFAMLTGLGPDEPAAPRGRAWFGAATQSLGAGDAVSPMCNGSADLGLAHEFPADCTVTFFAQEFGTYDPVRVFRAMRADNWLDLRTGQWHYAVIHGQQQTFDDRDDEAAALSFFRMSNPSPGGGVEVERATYEKYQAEYERLARSNKPPAR